MAVWGRVIVGFLARFFLELIFSVRGRNILFSFSVQKISPGRFFYYITQE